MPIPVCFSFVKPIMNIYIYDKIIGVSRGMYKIIYNFECMLVQLLKNAFNMNKLKYYPVYQMRNVIFPNKTYSFKAWSKSKL